MRLTAEELARRKRLHALYMQKWRASTRPSERKRRGALLAKDMKLFFAIYKLISVSTTIQVSIAAIDVAIMRAVTMIVLTST